MAYSDFTLPELKQKFQLSVNEKTDLFPTITGIPASAWLQETLRQTLPLGIQIGSEKARSELIIAPLLVEFRQQMNANISLFSGILFNVEPALGLTGFCDFIIARSPEQLSLTAPVLIVIEAKNENINAGVPQCLAAMVAARIFNERAGQALSPLFGAVTTGTNWRFLKLEENVAFVDRHEYYISEIQLILGILNFIASTEPTNLQQRAA